MLRHLVTVGIKGKRFEYSFPSLTLEHACQTRNHIVDMLDAIIGVLDVKPGKLVYTIDLDRKDEIKSRVEGKDIWVNEHSESCNPALEMGNG